jgi:membrane fusion protein, heavy metal efflux system
MKFPPIPLGKLVGGTAFSAVALGIALALPLMKTWLAPAAGASSTPAQREADKASLAGEDGVRVPAGVVKKLGLRTSEVKKATQPRPLPPLSGSLALDTNYLSRVHSRFAGEVVLIGDTADRDAGPPTPIRPLRYGDRVEKGQLLAIIWSKDLGEKKSELVDALSRLRLDQAILDSLRESFKKGAIPPRSVQEKERDVEAGQITVARIERTLQSWRLTEDEIDAVRKEAERVRANAGRRPPAQEQAWARVEVRAPFDGTILEKNVAVGDIVDTSTDLFKIADLTHLCVWAHAYEEDLPALQELPRPIRWTVRLKANASAKPLQGTVSRIGDIIDPNQHTALVMGFVDNPNGELRAGQFVTVTVELPPAPDEVVVPTAALLEDGRESVVFVQPDLKEPCFVLRHVKVLRRYHDVVYLQDTLKPGERVVVAGALELRAALEELQAANANEEEPAKAGG